MKQTGCSLINLPCTGIHLRPEACLGAVYCQEGLGIPFYFFRGLLPVIYIIRQCRDLAFHARRRAICGKRSYLCHLHAPFPVIFSKHNYILSKISVLNKHLVINYIRKYCSVRNFVSSAHNKAQNKPSSIERYTRRRHQNDF